MPFQICFPVKLAAERMSVKKEKSSSFLIKKSSVWVRWHGKTETAL